MDHRQRGVVLVTALVLLVVITLLSLTAIRSGTQELRMAANQEAQIDAFQTAVAIIDIVIKTPANLVVGGRDGSVKTISVPDTVAPFSDPLVDSHAEVVLQKADGAPPRTIGTSIDKFGAATFAIDARSDILSDATDRLVRAHAEVGQGFMILVPKSSQSN